MKKAIIELELDYYPEHITDEGIADMIRDSFMNDEVESQYDNDMDILDFSTESALQNDIMLRGIILDIKVFDF